MSMPHDEIDRELLWGPVESEVDVIDLIKYRDRKAGCRDDRNRSGSDGGLDEIGIEAIEEILVAAGSIVGFPVTARLVAAVFRKLRNRA